MSTKARNIPANGHRTRQRLLLTGVSESTIVARSGLGPSFVRSVLNRNQLNTSATIADIAKMLGMLGMTWGDLLDPDADADADADEPPQDPDTPSDDDAAILGNLLTREHSARKPETIATALGWTLTRLKSAEATLNARLRPAGMRVHDTLITGWKIAPYDGTADAASTRLAELHDYQRTPNSGMLRVLYAIYTNTLSTRETKSIHRVHLNGLLNRRIINSQTHQGQYHLSPEATYALDF